MFLSKTKINVNFGYVERLTQIQNPQVYCSISMGYIVGHTITQSKVESY